MKRNKRRKRKEKSVDESNPATWGPGTPETLLKARPHPLALWLKRGFISPDHVFAAERICMAYCSLYDGNLYSTSSLIKIQGGGQKCPSEYQNECIADYNAWLSEMSRYRLPSNLVTDMVVFETKPADLDRKHSKRSGWSKIVIKEGLDLYAIKILRAERAA